MATNGRGMQVVKVLNDHTYHLDESMLETVLLQDSIKDLPVVVVSVAGAYRGGKSFLLNFFIRYLSSTESARTDGSWLGADSAPLGGFNWRAGVARNTTGILLWSQPFINTLPNGEKVAVLLMDTQGTFDSQSTVRDNSTIFALSTLLSSVQIYNLSMNIQEDDLQHLHLFTMYGKMVQEKDQGGKAFQTLEFLVRDWPYPYDFPFGAEGGRRLLQQRLEVTSDLPEELKELRMHIRSSFEKVLCFLMPHPGFKVQNPAFKGNISDIQPEFRTHLKSLVTSLLSVEKMVPKTINGQKVKAGELFNYFKSYMNLFNSDEIPSPRSIMQATIEASLLSSMNEARLVYERGMDSECGPAKPAVSPEDLKGLHEKYLAAARKSFTDKKTMATEGEINKSLEKLSMELNLRLPQFEQSNLSKLQAVMKQAGDAYELSVKRVNQDRPLCLHPKDLEKVHQDARNDALKVYDGGVKKVSQKLDTKRAELLLMLDAHLVQLKLTNDKNNKDVLRDIHGDYWKFLETQSVNPPISDQQFKAAHEVGLNQALVKFQAARNRQSAYPDDEYKEELKKTIADTFWRLQAINMRKIEQENVRREQERQRIRQEQIKAEQARIKANQEWNAMKQKMTRLEQEKVAAEQEKRRIELENERLKNTRSGPSGDCTIL